MSTNPFQDAGNIERCHLRRLATALNCNCIVMPSNCSYDALFEKDEIVMCIESKVRHFASDKYDSAMLEQDKYDKLMGLLAKFNCHKVMYVFFFTDGKALMFNLKKITPKWEEKNLRKNMRIEEFKKEFTIDIEEPNNRKEFVPTKVFTGEEPEEWRQIINHTHIEVSTFGNVRVEAGYKVYRKILRGNGMVQIAVIGEDKTSFFFQLHNEVIKFIIPDYKMKKMIWVNGNKSDCRLVNLKDARDAQYFRNKKCIEKKMNGEINEGSNLGITILKHEFKTMLEYNGKAADELNRLRKENDQLKRKLARLGADVF